MSAVLKPGTRPYSRDFRPQPEQVPALSLVPMEPRGWNVGRTAMGKAAAEQNFLNHAARADRMVDYIAALKETTDAEWRYEMAEGSDYSDGARHFARLWEMQADLDPSGAIWRSVAPEGLGVPQPRVKAAQS